jgi:hypothetical protein
MYNDGDFTNSVTVAFTKSKSGKNKFDVSVSTANVDCSIRDDILTFSKLSSTESIDVTNISKNASDGTDVFKSMAGFSTMSPECIEDKTTIDTIKNIVTDIYESNLWRLHIIRVATGSIVLFTLGKHVFSVNNIESVAISDSLRHIPYLNVRCISHLENKHNPRADILSYTAFIILNYIRKELTTIINSMKCTELVIKGK